MKKSKSKDLQDEAEKGILLQDRTKPTSSNATTGNGNMGAGISTAANNNCTPPEEQDRIIEFLSCVRECRVGDLIEILKDDNIAIDLEKTEDANYTALHYINLTSKEFIQNKGKRDARRRCAKALLNYKNGKFKKFLIESKDIYGNTPLHHACQFKRLELINVFLNNGADPLLKRNDQETPLSLLADGSSPDLIEKMRHMIDHCKSFLTNDDMKKPFATSLSRSNSIDMLQFWIEEMKMDPNALYEGVSALHLAMTGNTDETAKCVEYILTKMQDIKAQINNALGRYGLIPLHTAALTSNWRVLKVLIQNRYIDLKKLTPTNESVLHFIVLGHLNGAAACECLQLVIQSTQYWLQKDKENFYYNIKNNDGETAFEETAFDLACRLRAINLVTQFVNMDKMDRHNTYVTKDRLSTIYKLCPLALIQNLTDSISEGERHNQIQLNTRYLVGKDKENNKSTLSTDTKCLYEVLKAKPEEDRDKILNNIAVKIYLDIKWKRIRKFALAWTALQVLFMICYTILLLDIQKVNEQNSTEPGRLLISEVLDFNKDSQSISIILVVVTFALSFLMLFKEIFQAVSWIAYIKSPANWGQLLFLIAFYTSIISGYWKNEKALFSQTVFGSFGAFLGWILLIRDIGKLPKYERYAEILAKVCKSSIKMVIFYSGCLIGALVVFRLLMKNNDGFHLPFGFAKIFAMMVGDLAYDDLFDEKHKIQYEEIAKLLVICFTFVASIVLFNLLVALAVSDINELKECAERTRRVGQVQFIYALENCFKAFEKCKCLKSVYSSFCVKDVEKIKIDTFPDTTQVELREMTERLFLEANKTDEFTSQRPVSTVSVQIGY